MNKALLDRQKCARDPFRRCRMFGYNTPCGKIRIDLSSFFEPFPIAKRRKKWSGCILEYYLRECEPLTLDLKETLFLLTLESGKLLGSWRKRTFRICYEVKIIFLLNSIKKHNLLILCFVDE